MGRKNHYDSIEDLFDDLDHESLLDDDLLDDEDLALLHGPKAPEQKKAKPKRKAPAKKPKKK